MANKLVVTLQIVIRLLI